MFSYKFFNLRSLYQYKTIHLRLINFDSSSVLFSNKILKPPSHKEFDSDGKKSKTPEIPKITLISSENNINVVTLTEAQQLAKRRDLKLIKIVDIDTKTKRPIYKLMTGSQYHAEDIKQKEQRKIEKSNYLKGEKLLMLNANINSHDLDTTVKKILKWTSKKYEVRISITGDASNKEKSERVYKFLEDALKDKTRLLQKRAKGNDLRFQVTPLKENQHEKKQL